MLALRRVSARPLWAVQRPTRAYKSTNASRPSSGTPKTASTSNPATEPSQGKTEKEVLYEMQAEDFRPPWVYTATNLMNYVLIPGIFLYSIFIYDWGDHDHVFQAPRRWLKRQKEAFWSLSSEDQKLIEATESKPETSKST